MDFSKFKTSDWLKVGGAAAILIGYFLNWTDIPGAGDFNFSGSEFFFRGTVPWLLTVAVGVIALLLAGGVMKAGSLPWPLIMIAATGLSTLLVAIYVINPSYSGVSDIGRGIGSYLSLIGAAVALAGSVIGFKESGGDLSDLKDMNKLKASFGGSSGGSTPPPPPPGGVSPPPPPPPPAG